MNSCDHKVEASFLNQAKRLEESGYPLERSDSSDDDWRSSTASSVGACTEAQALLHCMNHSKKTARRVVGACNTRTQRENSRRLG
ncbi:hypothetical protein HPB52_017570 [Rhipicephalus sanguineus]|uniref:Uncharacterized protein n=1 Tax=Rhipicephalus sanguineus TaxID=34632 RepID=A0A9D4PKE2_RHISA|nr:hypothetical protein HPB52_017570 [Rhipicephalus sanguineus]